MFSHLARWRKDRIGGTGYYLDCEVAEGYTELPLAMKPKALPRLGFMAKDASHVSRRRCTTSTSENRHRWRRSARTDAEKAALERAEALTHVAETHARDAAYEPLARRYEDRPAALSARRHPHHAIARARQR
jgi:hypothetical protein